MDCEVTENFYYFYWGKWIDDSEFEDGEFLTGNPIEVLEVIEDNVTFSYEELFNFAQTIKNSNISVFQTALNATFEQRKHFGRFKEDDVLTKQDIVDGSTGIKDKYGNTILHYFALKNIQCVLEHPSCNTVQNDFGFTPLKSMVYAGYDCSSHPDYETVKIKQSKKCKPEFIEDDDSERSNTIRVTQDYAIHHKLGVYEHDGFYLGNYYVFDELTEPISE